MSQIQYYRTDTIEEDNEQIIVDPNIQQCIGVLGRRGKGKSTLVEALAVGLHNLGWTIFDLWASDNLENAFYCIKYKIRIPVTILAPTTVKYDQFKIDLYNEKLYTKKEWRKKGYLEYDSKNPPFKPKSKQGKEWIKIVKLPYPTMKDDTEPNQEIVKIFINALLECRSKRRILVFNPMMFPDEKQMYKTLEIIIRSLREVRTDHFRALDEVDLDKPRDQFTPVEKNWDKLCLVIREFAELTPSKLKGDKLGHSTLVKKAMLQFMRKARHYQMSCIADWQKYNDVEDAIRSQFDLFLLKKWNIMLAGDEWIHYFDYVNNNRRYIFETIRNKKLARIKADSLFPPIDKLAKKYMYVKFGAKLVLWNVPELLTKHKEAYEDWDKFTGIRFKFEKIKLGAGATASIKSSSESDELFVYTTITNWKNKTGKKMDRNMMKVELGRLQDAGKVNWHTKLSDMKPNTFTKMFSTLAKKYKEVKLVETKK